MKNNTWHVFLYRKCLASHHTSSLLGNEELINLSLAALHL